MTYNPNMLSKQVTFFKDKSKTYTGEIPTFPEFYNRSSYLFPQDFRRKYRNSHILPIKFSDKVPPTLANFYKFHIVTNGAYLSHTTDEERKQMVDLLTKCMGDGSKWDNLPVLYQFGRYEDVFTNQYLLELAGDRVRYLPSPCHIENGDMTGWQWLKKAGIGVNELLANMIKFIESTNDFEYADNIANFLRGRIEIVVKTSNLWRWKKKAAGIYSLSPGATDLITGGSKGYAYTYTRALLYAYLGEHSQWCNSDSTVNIEGSEIYVDHHELFESVTLLVDYFKENKKYPNKLPFGLSPQDYFAELIQIHAQNTHDVVQDIGYPSNFKAILDLTDSPHRQLLTGLDLVNEGCTMRHCVGGERYRSEMVEGDTLFFHLEVPNLKHGATLSMEITSDDAEGSGVYCLGGSKWIADQYYGYDDEELYDNAKAMSVRRDFLDKYFVKAEVKPTIEVGLSGLPRVLEPVSVTLPMVNTGKSQVVHRVIEQLRTQYASPAVKSTPHIQVIRQSDNAILSDSKNNSPDFIDDLFNKLMKEGDPIYDTKVTAVDGGYTLNRRLVGYKEIDARNSLWGIMLHHPVLATSTRNKDAYSQYFDKKPDDVVFIKFKHRFSEQFFPTVAITPEEDAAQPTLKIQVSKLLDNRELEFIPSDKPYRKIVNITLDNGAELKCSFSDFHYFNMVLKPGRSFSLYHDSAPSFTILQYGEKDELCRVKSNDVITNGGEEDIRLSFKVNSSTRLKDIEWRIKQHDRFKLEYTNESVLSVGSEIYRVSTSFASA